MALIMFCLRDFGHCSRLQLLSQWLKPHYSKKCIDLDIL